MMKRFALIIALLLAACETPAEIASRELAEEVSDRAHCQRFADGLADCMARQKRIRELEAIVARGGVYYPLYPYPRLQCEIYPSLGPASRASIDCR